MYNLNAWVGRPTLLHYQRAKHERIALELNPRDRTENAGLKYISHSKSPPTKAPYIYYI